MENKHANDTETIKALRQQLAETKDYLNQLKTEKVEWASRRFEDGERETKLKEQLDEAVKENQNLKEQLYGKRTT